MLATFLKAILSAGAVWVIAALSAKLARKSAALEQVQRETAEREKVEQIINSVADLPADDVRQRLQNIGRNE